MLKIGVLGAGHLGKIHLKLLKELPQYEVVGFYDPNDEQAAKAQAETGLHRWADIEKLVNAVDVVDIVATTTAHYECAALALKKSKHIFIEKPLTNTMEEANSLLSLAHEASVKVMVGHVERFNPAFLAIADRPLKPMFIEVHRLAQFNPRGTDVSVVLDLMIHDLDIVLSLVKANVRRISASGVAVVSKEPDIANARIEFDNGCVANLTASRISMKQMRKVRLFQQDTYISVDLLDKKTEIVSLRKRDEDDDSMAFEIETGTDGEKKIITFESPKILEGNAIKMELESFYDSIVNETEPRVTLMDGYNALHVAHQILEKIEKNKIA
ncbi:MAG: Gfo/Idh/MocA family oxidoreductase [Chitinophagales bacterium]|nr:Gfo/Idh/MocA family oxidoreductase [Chitinophagales bacterium]